MKKTDLEIGASQNKKYQIKGSINTLYEVKELKGSRTKIDQQGSKDNIGKEKFGVRIYDPSHTEENLDWCDIAVVTGTTVVNNTIDQFRISKPVVFYGVTITGVAKLLGLNHFCSLGS